MSWRITKTNAGQVKYDLNHLVWAYFTLTRTSRRAARAWWLRLYDPCVVCWRPARRGGFLLCARCTRAARLGAGQA